MPATLEEPKTTRKYVVETDSVGRFERGDVVEDSRENFPIGVSHLLAGGHLRPATSFEAVLPKVNLAGRQQSNLSAEEARNIALTENMELKRKVADLEAHIRGLESAHVPIPSVVQEQEQAWRELMMEKDKTITGLQAELEKVRTQINISNKRK